MKAHVKMIVEGRPVMTPILRTKAYKTEAGMLRSLSKLPTASYAVEVHDDNITGWVFPIRTLIVEVLAGDVRLDGSVKGWL